MTKRIPPVLEIDLTRFRLAWVLFTPAQVSEITGLSPVMQGDWRRRDILPKHGGHARFNAIEIAEIWLLKMLSDRGVGPQHCKHLARRGAEGVVLAALQNPEAWSQVPRKESIPRRRMNKGWFNKYFREASTARFLVWWSDGSIEWAGNLSAAFTKVSSADEANVDGPLIVLDTRTIGRRLVEKAGLPLVHNQTGRPRRD